MWPRTFLRTLYQSISSVRYYHDVLHTRFWFSVRFFVLATALIGLIEGILVVVIALPIYHQRTEDALTTLEHNYPPDLQITWDKKSLQVEPTQVLQIPYPSGFKSDVFPPTLAVVDTLGPDEQMKSQQQNQEADMQRVDAYKHAALMVVTQDTLYVPSGQSIISNQRGWNSVRLEDVPGFETAFTLNKSTLPELSKIWHEEFDALFSFLQVALPFIVPVLSVVIQAVGLFLDVLIAYLCVKVSGLKVARVPLSFRSVLQLGLHITVVAQVVNLIAEQLALDSLPLFTLTFWLYFTIVLISLRKEGVENKSRANVSKHLPKK